ncbi:MAG TPA: alpha/beta fold hydrolase [Kiritimatiellia bacterium]|nr:alpha/beta fold hydrolase [Kiritimatiellia bacterium]HMO99400.1 alpha/beta fold hydrolase [Kiritimatiellia bacterium]HMP97611.1 alpha/beta fold hydrolase [Kiritimatiellia bacterium]
MDSRRSRRRYRFHPAWRAALPLLIIGLASCRSPRVPMDIPWSGWHQHEETVDQHLRPFWTYVPASLNTTGHVPVVIVLHGGGQTPEDIMKITRFNDLADRYGFIVVYPSGTGTNPRRLYWNVLLSRTFATQKSIDDFTYLDRVLHRLKSQLPVDEKAIFAAGFCQGAMLAYRLACDEQWSHRLAAIAAVAGVMTVAPDDCRAERLVPILSFHGRRDPFSRFDGGIAEKAPRLDRVSRPGVPETIAFWTGRGGLTAPPDTSASRGDARVSHYGPDENGYEVISWVLDNGGHTWPGGYHVLPEWMVGPVNRDIHAGNLIWQFFSRHRLIN